MLQAIVVPVVVVSPPLLTRYLSDYSATPLPTFVGRGLIVDLLHASSLDEMLVRGSEQS